MKTFTAYLAESKVTDAMDILDIDSDYTPASLKTAFKRAASRAHPDKGGSDLAMRNVKQAYDLLTKTTVAKVVDRDAQEKDYDKLADIVLSTVDAGLDADAFSAYFEKTLKKKFIHTREFSKHVTSLFMNSVSILHTWETTDKKTKFFLKLYVDLNKAERANGLSNANSAIFDTSVTPTTYVDGRKKVLKNKWMSTNDSKFFAVPSKIFTKASITSKKGKFGKKDMMYGLVHRANATTSGDYFYIPMADGIHHLQVYRTVSMRTPQWNVGYIYTMDGRRKQRTDIDVPLMGMLLETEKLLEAFIEVTKERNMTKAFKLIKECAWKED